MANPLVADPLCVWGAIHVMLPKKLPKKKRRTKFLGRHRVPDRAALTGILFLLKSGIPCWRWLRDWQKAGVWTKFHHELLPRLHKADRLDWSRAVVDANSVCAVFGGFRPDRARPPAAKRAANIIFALTPKVCRCASC